MTLPRSSLVCIVASLLALGAGCSEPAPPNQQKAQPPAPVASAPQPATASAPEITPPPPAVTPVPTEVTPPKLAGMPVITPVAASGPLPPAGQAINAAVFPRRRGAAAHGYDAALVRAEVLLDRAGFSPGAIDGRKGSNLARALTAFTASAGETSSGALDRATWNRLVSADAAPVVQAYVIAPADLAGPFIGAPPKDYSQLARLKALAYSSPRQELAERFHMSEELLAALNPNVDFGKAGQTILVAAPRSEPRSFEADRIEVDKTRGEVRAFDAQGRLEAVYPATVGSTERPAPSGVFKVTAVAPHPAYFYDPRRLTFTPKGAKGALRIAPGPNNPVGAVWIALDIPTYGIHGAPDPTTVGKAQSHGCVRLTNWDAVELSKAVHKGAEVDFVGSERQLARR